MPISSGFQVNEILTASNTNSYLLRPYRNAVINGAMQISERSTSVAGIVNTIGYFTADRWVTSISGSAGVWTQTVQSLSASSSPLIDGIRNSMRMTCTTATPTLVSGSYAVMAQRFEGNAIQQFAKGTSNAKPFSLSFWVRSNVVGTYIVELIDVDNNRYVSQSYTITSSGVWQKVRLTFPPDLTGLFDNDNNNSLELLLWFLAGSSFQSSTLETTWGSPTNNQRASGQVNCASAVNNYFEFTGVQIEPNVVCTPFDIKSAGDEFVTCRRYFQRHYQPSLRGVSNSSFTRMALHFGTPMRAIPTATGNGGTMGFWDGASSPIGNVGIVGVYNASNTTIEFDLSSSGWTIGRAACMYQITNGTFYLDLNAEL